MAQHAVSLSEQTDDQLIQLTREGDMDAYSALWQRHSAVAVRVARRATNKVDPEDLASEAFMNVLKAIKNGSGPRENFRAYLLTAVRNVAATQGSSGDSQPRSPFDEEVLSQTIPVEDHQESVAEKMLTVRAFRSLPTRWQEVLWYRDVEDLSVADVAKIVGMSANAVTQLIRRAREGMKQAWIQGQLNASNTTPECAWLIERVSKYSRDKLTVATSSGTGSISYQVVANSAANCSVNVTTGVMTAVTAGTCVIRATAAANATYASAYADVAWTIAQASQTVSWPATNVNVFTTASPLTLNALASSSGTGAISYSVTSAGTSGCTIDASTGIVSFSTSGTCVLRATAAENDTYTSAVTSLTVTIVKAPQVVSWSPSNTALSVAGSPATPSSVASTNGDGSITYSVSSAGTSGCTVNATTGVLTYTDNGTCTIRATAAETNVYLAASTDVVFTMYDAPVANDDDGNTGVNEAKLIDAIANDSGSGLRITSYVATGDTHGTVFDNGDGTFTYTPTTGHVGLASFTYTVTDVTGETDTATVSIHVTANTPPTAQDIYEVSAMGALTTLSPLTSSTGMSLTVTVTSNPAHGSAVVQGDGTITYTPVSTWFGVEAFTYRVTDSAGQTATATIQINILAAPITANDRVTVPFNASGSVSVMSNDVGTALSVTSAGPLSGWTITHTATKVNFTPPVGFSGVAQFAYVVTDSVGQSAQGRVTVTVTDQSGGTGGNGGTDGTGGNGSTGGTGSTHFSSFGFSAAARLAATGASGFIAPWLAFGAPSALVVLGVLMRMRKRRKA
jgi:RNA polymerase sigma factor (sigma-70 family)